MVVEQSNLSTIDNEIIQEEINNKLTKIKIRHAISGFIKRGIDLVAGIVGCLLLIPITLFVVISNALNKDNGPILFTQERIGKNGKVFKMYKYRSMVVNADKKLKRYLLDNPQANEEFKIYRKLKEDPRITLVGKFIRKTSLDEFPQFINVLKGDMSLVGPRPYLPREKRAMKKAYHEIIKVKPGLTGPWQVNGRSEISLKDRMQMDVEYITSEGALSDIKFLIKTVFKIFKTDKGAI